MSLQPGTRLGPYEIVSVLGMGGMGEVYRAHDPRLGRDVAVKVIPVVFASDPERLARFEQEARAAAALNHPNILAVYDIGTHDGAPYIVSELLEGETLRERLGGGALPMRIAVEHGVQICHGLAAAHQKGIVHRDLKPENIFLTSDGHVKLLDFGLAKLTQIEPAFTGSALPTTPPNTVPGVVLGTIGYMSPEQVRGLATDRRSDIFAFGATLYEMLSGHRAFRGETTMDTMMAIVKEAPPELPADDRQISPALQRIIDRCLEKNAANRFQSAGDLAFALEGMTAHSGEVAAMHERIPVHSWRERLAWSLIAVLVVAVAAMVMPTLRYLRRAAVVAAPEMRVEVTTPPTSDPVSLAISPDGAQLVFVASPQGNPQLWLRPLNSVKAEALAGTERASYPFWSPDSRSIGFFADGKLKRLDVAGGPPQTLATVASPRGASWGPDSKILFGTGSRPITWISATGGELTALLRLQPGQTAQFFPQWLPDSRHFLYTVAGTPAAGGIYVASIDEPAGHRLLSDYSIATYVSPGLLLFVRQGVILAQRFDVEKLALVGEAFRLVDDVAFTPGTGAAAISASASGTIVYRTAAAGPALAWFDRTGRELEVIKGSDRADPTGPELSPDGHRIALFRTVDRNADIYVVEATRGITTRFTVNEAGDGWPAWSPDGKALLFASNQKGRYDLYRRTLSVGGTEETVLQSSPRWTPKTDN